MFDVTFFNFAKKDNSTARPPAGSGTTLKCAIKTPSSILSPVVEVSGDLFPGNQYPTWNYAHIPAFNGRRYFVTNKVYDRGIWEISLAEDVLASYRTTISNMSAYVLRSSRESDGWLVDRLYPARSTYRTDNIWLDEDGPLVTWDSGSVVVNILSPNNTSGYTSYVFDTANFGTFLSKLSTDLTDTSVSTWDGVTQSIKVTTYEPLRYIGSILWFPESSIQGISKTSIKLGNYEITGIMCKQPVSFTSTGLSYIKEIPKHPQAGERGQYMNLAPFSEYTLQLGPFGSFKLDPTGLNGQRYLHAVVDADLITGIGRAFVTAGQTPLPNLTDDVLLANVTCQYGVPIRINSINNVSAGAMFQTIGGLATTIGGVAAGDPGAALSGVSAAFSGIENMAKGSVDSVGSTGSIGDHQMKKTLYCRFFYAVDENVAENGRPLCKYRRLGSLPGFIQVQKGNFAYEQATKAEVSAVNSYLEGGFYFE